MRLQLLSGLAGLLVGASAFAQVHRTFPAEITDVDSVSRTVTVATDLGELPSLRHQGSAQFAGLLLPGGEVVDLDLRQLDLARMKYGFRVDGQARPDLLDGLDLSVWMGQVVGEPQSDVLLSFSSAGTRGWIQRGDELVHLMPRPDARGDWANGSTVLMRERDYVELNGQRPSSCATDRLKRPTGETTARTSGNEAPLSEYGTQMLGSCNLRECTVAVETDFQLYQVFGNDLNAETAYFTTLSAAASARYEQQFDTVLTYPYVQFYTNSNDPWTSQDGGGGSVDLLYEFQGAWTGSVPTGATLAHFLSGANLGGGVAWLDVLCDDEFNFGVSGNIDGDVSFPVSQGPDNWDFMVFCHELGHNFSSPHTHDYCPPIDSCFDGQCTNGTSCTNQGTIMSYCHLCPGGLANITTFFAPEVVAQVAPAVQACLPLYSGIAITPPTIVSNTSTTEVTAQIAGGVNGNVELNYRYDGGSYNTLVMADQGGGLYSANLPAADCNDTPEFYVSFDSQICGLTTAPSGGAGSPYTAAVGEVMISFQDDFEVFQGWTTLNNGASSGDWQRGVPVDDGGWDYDPSSDGDGSGSCYLTQNENGNTDVDDGSVTLFSPSIDMTGGGVSIEYDYFLRLTDEDGTDRLLVEANNNAGAGSWTTIATHDTNGGLAWRHHVIDMESAGITLTTDMVIRFTANDGDAQSIVEAGVDGFEVFSVSCDGGNQPGPYCDPANPNSFSAFGGVLTHVSGSPGGTMTFDVTQVPNTPGIFYYGPNQGDLPFGCGRRCVVGGITRTGVFFATGHSVNAVLDTTGASTPFNIQYWFRDPSNEAFCGDEFNTTNAVGF